MAKSLGNALQTAVVIHQIIAVAAVTEKLDALELIGITVFLRS